MKAPPAFVCSLALLFAACAAPPAASTEPEVRLVYLQHAQAAEVAIRLRPLLSLSASLDLLEVPGLNGILLRGPPSECDALATEIRRLDLIIGG